MAGPFCSSLFLGASIFIDSLVFWFLYECIGTLCEESVTHFHPSSTLLQLPSCLRGPASCSYITYKTYMYLYCIPCSCGDGSPSVECALSSIGGVVEALRSGVSLVFRVGWMAGSPVPCWPLHLFCRLVSFCLDTFERYAHSV